MVEAGVDGDFDQVRGALSELGGDTVTVDALQGHLLQSYPGCWIGPTARQRIVSALRRLEEQGLGKFIVGRRGQPSRFKHRRDGQPKTQAPPLIDPGRMVEHLYQLRPDLRIGVELPADLTAAEAGRLADFVKTLPFERGWQSR